MYDNSPEATLAMLLTLANMEVGGMPQSEMNEILDKGDEENA